MFYPEAVTFLTRIIMKLCICFSKLLCGVFVSNVFLNRFSIDPISWNALHLNTSYFMYEYAKHTHIKTFCP